MIATEAFQKNLTSWSDIQGHLPLLYNQSQGNILEFGVRDGVSTSAFLAGVERYGGDVVSVDINPQCGELFKGNKQWRFIEGSSVDVSLTKVIGPGFLVGKGLDMLFLDTLHTYEHVTRELEIWGRFVRIGGSILVHDVITFSGVTKAVKEYAEKHFYTLSILGGSNGLGFIGVR